VSERTNDAATAIAAAVAIADRKPDTWRDVGLVIGYLIVAVNELLEAVEDLERRDE
jgi:hypothetical protein